MHAKKITMKSRLARLAMAMLLGFGFTAPATLQASNYDSGIFEFQQKLAKGGNAQAQYQLATMYESGRGVEKNIEKAQEWYKKSAAGNYKAAQHRLTYLEVKTTGFKSDHKPWLQELSADAKGGDGEAMFILGHMYEYGNGVKRSLKRAQAYYKSSASRGNVDAETRLFSIEQTLSQSKPKTEPKVKDDAAKKQQEAAAKEKAEEERKARAAAAAAREKALNDRKKAELERRKLEAERKKLETERRKLEAQKRAIEAQQAAEARADEEAARKAEEEKQKKENEKFQSELCSGKAARFRTQCQ